MNSLVKPKFNALSICFNRISSYPRSKLKKGSDFSSRSSLKEVFSTKEPFYFRIYQFNNFRMKKKNIEFTTKFY